jgi:thioester reductase-like protein
MAQGYSESKWVTEMLLKSAGELSGVSSAVLRVGQIAGPVNVAAGKYGMWNKQEWLPTVIVSFTFS